MRISFRLDSLNSHAHFAVFVNGAKAGDLCMRADEYREFVYFMENGMQLSNVRFFAVDDTRKAEERR